MIVQHRLIAENGPVRREERIEKCKKNNGLLPLVRKSLSTGFVSLSRGGTGHHNDVRK
jgi:hypothetical protein